MLQEAERIRAEGERGGPGKRREMRADMEDRVGAPKEQDDHHDGGDLHDLQGFVAGLVDALDVLPPVISGDEDGNGGRGEVHR